MTTSRKNKRPCSTCHKFFVPEHDTPTIVQKVCSCKCCVTFYDGLKKKGRKASRVTSAMVGRRSMAEVRFDASFIEGKRNVHAHYEISQFEYEVHETRKYTPDWTLIVQPGGHHIYIEFKGVLDQLTRKKMKLVKKEHPSLDIRLVFEKASNKIRKGSKTTYGMWADQWGFPWADNVLPKDWLK